MASVGELKDAIKDTMDRKGLLKQLQGHVRAQVYKILIDTEEEERPEPSNENLIINELIREYLISNGYRDTLSVFIPESGQPQTRPFDREFLARHLNMTETKSTEQVPLLYSLVAQQQSLKAPATKQLGSSIALQPQQLPEATVTQRAAER